MDLNNILRKTKKKARNTKVKRSPPFIASRERPYDISEIKADKTPHLHLITHQDTKRSVPSALNVGLVEGLVDDSIAEIKRNRERRGNKEGTNGEQKENNVLVYTPFSHLVGLQREIILVIYQECKKTRSKITESLTLDYISRFIGTTPGAVKTTLKRLKGKGCIVRRDCKKGRGGWTRYELSEQIFRDVLQYETSYGGISFANNIREKKENKPGTNGEQSVNILDPQLNIRECMPSLPVEWDNIDVEPLTNISFSKTHIAQLYKTRKLTPQEIQISIHAFAFDLRVNNKGDSIKGSSLSYFMGILQKGIPYAPPENYESPEDRAIREYNERQKALIAKRKALEEESFNLAFKEWEARHPEEELKKICLSKGAKASQANDLESPIRIGVLQAYFRENIWPEYKNKILQATT